MRILSVITKANSEVVEYVVLEDGRYPNLGAVLAAALGAFDASGGARSMMIVREFGVSRMKIPIDETRSPHGLDIRQGSD